MGLNSNWDNCSFELLGQEWNYATAIESKVYEGFFESGFQLILQAYIQMQTSWALFLPLTGPIEKGIYFDTAKPGDLKTSQVILYHVISLIHKYPF